VQAASPTGSVNSATYDAKNSQIHAYFSSRNAYKVELGLISQHGGGTMEKPLCKKSFGVIDGATSLADLDVKPEWEEGLYQVLLYLNGSKSVSGAKAVNVTAKGSIKSVNISRDNETFTVSYSMQHGSAYSSSLRIYDDAGKSQLYRENLKKKYSDPNPNTNVNTYRKFSLPYSTLNNKLKAGQYYRCRLYTNEYDYTEFRFRMPELPTLPPPPPAAIKITPMGGDRLKFDFTISNTGVDVAFRVTAASLTNYTGETNTYYYGVCDQYQGTYEVTVPHYTGQVIYAVELLVNGSSVNGASIQVYNR
jgi:hypothetical protein